MPPTLLRPSCGWGWVSRLGFWGLALLWGFLAWRLGSHAGFPLHMPAPAWALVVLSIPISSSHCHDTRFMAEWRFLSLGPRWAPGFPPCCLPRAGSWPPCGVWLLASSGLLCFGLPWPLALARPSWVPLAALVWLAGPSASLGPRHSMS